MAKLQRMLGVGKPPSDRNDARAFSLGIEREANEIIYWSGAARRVTTSVAGILILTSRRVIHRASGISRIFDPNFFEIRRREVIDVGVKPIDTSHWHGMNEMSLRLILVGGHEELFIVENRTEAFEQFSKFVTPIGG